MVEVIIMAVFNTIKLFLKKRLSDEQRAVLRRTFNAVCRFVPSIYLIIKYRNYRPKNYLSVAAIIKNEGPYIAEWIEYHLLVGVTKFYIYDNESEDNLKDILEPYIRDGIVEYKYYPGKKKQIPAYYNVLKKARIETYWLALIDCDEFIVPVSTETIPELLKEFESVTGGGRGYSGLGINWMMYGSSGQQTKKEGLVIERFKDHAEEKFSRNLIIKTILNPRDVVSISIHYAIYRIGKFCVNTNKDILSYRSSDVVFDKIRINHYFSKSYEEFLQKAQKGSANHGTLKSIQQFYDYDRNEIKNDPIMDKYIPKIYKNIEERYKKQPL